MSLQKTTYVIEVDDSNGKVKIQGITKDFVEADVAAKKLNETLVTTSKNAGQMANKTGLAGAAVVEIGRTISDANFGMTAMANNLQQLSTLMVTLIATSGGVANAFTLIKQALLGPLGIIIIFQTLITLFERVSISSKKVKEEMDVNKEVAGQILDTHQDINDELRKRLKISKKLSKERVKELLALELELDVEKTKLDIRMENLKVSDDIRQKIDKFFGRTSEQSPEIKSTQNALDSVIERLRKVRDILAGEDDGDDDFKGKKGPKQKKARIITQAEITEFEIEEMNRRLKLMANKEEEEAALIKLNSDFRKKIREEEAKHAEIMTNSIIDGFFAMGELAGEHTAGGKALAVAGALIDTYAAIAGQLKAFSGVPIPGYAVAQAVATGLVGFAQVKRILAVRVPGGRDSSSSNSAGAVDNVIRPNFNIVGTSNASQIQGAVERGLRQPIKTFITTKEIYSAEELDRNTVGGSRIG